MLNGLAGIMSGLGAASIGAVTALIVADRISREGPAGKLGRFCLAAWGITFAAGVTIITIFFAGFGGFLWMSIGAAMGALVTTAISSARRDMPPFESRKP